MKTLLERFEDKYIPEPNSGCWLWTGAELRDGYGYFRISKTAGMARAHRVAYELYRDPIPTGLVIDHLCRVRLCVNPQHLEAVTNRENVMRGNQRYVLASRLNVCPRGHVGAYQVFGNEDHRRCAECRYEARRVNWAERRLSSSG